MAPVRTGVHIVWADMLAVMQGQKKLEELDHLNAAAADMLDQLVWWTKAPDEHVTWTRSIRRIAICLSGM